MQAAGNVDVNINTTPKALQQPALQAVAATPPSTELVANPPLPALSTCESFVVVQEVQEKIMSPLASGSLVESASASAAGAEWAAPAAASAETAAAAGAAGDAGAQMDGSSSSPFPWPMDNK